jgi:hypothetical protein
MNDKDVDFAMTTDKARAARTWFKTCWRPHLWIFYGSIIVIDLVAISLLRSK